MGPSKQKSRTFRRVFKRTTGKTKVDYVLRKPKKLRCSNCGKELMGIPRMRPTEVRHSPKTSKRPERAYGGTYCSSCSRRLIIARSR